MIANYWSSLQFRLTRRLVLWQLATLVVFVLIAAIPIARLNSGVGLDDRVVFTIAEAVRVEDGAVVVADTSALAEIEAEHPNFWYYLRTSTGEVVSSGDVPEPFAPALGQLGFISFGDFGSDAFPELASLIVRQAPSQAGPLHIATGGGPRFQGLSVGLLLANRFFVIPSVVLTLVMIVAIALTLRTALKGLDRVAADAARIDVDQQGRRLDATAVPAEIRPLVEAFNDALARLDDGIARRQRFMADAAHELRTPIAILQTRLELLDASPEREQLLLDTARLSNLADQLLDLQRIEAGHRPLETLDLVALGAAATSDMAPLAIASHDDIAFDGAPGPLPVKADRLALSRAVTNLIQNAISHAGAGAEIVVRVGEDGGRATIAVEDNGPGIPAEQRLRIFEPFYRMTPSSRGAGLGLNLVHEIVAHHQGTIRVGDSALGGAAFVISLPLAQAA